MKQLIPLTALAALAAASPIHAQTPAFSKPSGYLTNVIVGKDSPTSQEVFNLVGAPLKGSPLTAGNITAIISDKLTDSQANFSSLAAGTYILEITSGNGVGIVQDFNSFTSTEINLVADLTANGVQVGDSYRVRAVQTVSGIFGTPTTSPLLQGTPTTADIVWVSNGAGGFDRFYISPASPPFVPEPAWTKIGGGANPDQSPILYTDAIIVQRRGEGSVNIVVTGEVNTDLVVYPVLGGPAAGRFNYYATPFPTNLSSEPTISSAETTVGSLGLTSLLNEGSPTTADILWLPQGDGTYKRYYNSSASPPFKPTATFDEIGGLTNIDPATLRMPSAYIIQRRGTDANSTANPPAGFSNL